MSTYEHLHANIAIGRAPRKRELLRVTLQFRYCSIVPKGPPAIWPPTDGPQEVFFLKRQYEEGRQACPWRKELKMSFVILWLTHKVLLVLFWGPLGVESVEDESTVVLFSEGTSVRIGLIFGNSATGRPPFQGVLGSPQHWPICANNLAVLSIPVSPLQPILRVHRLFPSKNCGCEAPKLGSYILVICLGRVHE